jgi:pantoate--beta-alanine ligase
MKTIADPTKMQAFSRALLHKGKSLGFVPTMGALHEGHLELVRASRKKNTHTIVSIYVNPLQFGPKEDLAQYPRTLRADLALLKKEKVAVVFTPSDKEMYPAGFSTGIKVSVPVVAGLCAPYRPGHFDGVATVVVKLLGAVQPTRLYLGQKDAQQAAVLKQVIQDLNLDVEAVVCPIVRERDGLAMSSRNKRLTPEGRRIAPVLYRALKAGKRAAGAGGAKRSKVISEMKRAIAKESIVKLQYLEAVDAETLLPVARVKRGTMLALAAHLENVRLIDNIIV